MVLVINLKLLCIFRLFYKHFWFLWSRKNDQMKNFEGGSTSKMAVGKMSKTEIYKAEIQRKHSCMHSSHAYDGGEFKNDTSQRQ